MGRISVPTERSRLWRKREACVQCGRRTWHRRIGQRQLAAPYAAVPLPGREWIVREFRALFPPHSTASGPNGFWHSGPTPTARSEPPGSPSDPSPAPQVAPDRTTAVRAPPGSVAADRTRSGSWRCRFTSEPHRSRVRQSQAISGGRFRRSRRDQSELGGASEPAPRSSRNPGLTHDDHPIGEGSNPSIDAKTGSSPVGPMRGFRPNGPPASPGNPDPLDVSDYQRSEPRRRSSYARECREPSNTSLSRRAPSTLSRVNGPKSRRLPSR